MISTIQSSYVYENQTSIIYYWKHNKLTWNETYKTQKITDMYIIKMDELPYIMLRFVDDAAVIILLQPCATLYKRKVE